MLCYHTTLNLARFLTRETSKLKEDECDIQVISVDVWKHYDFLCINYVMNALIDFYTMCIQIRNKPISYGNH